jgi:Ni,Fe-hydrogenase I small subunit
MRKVFGKSACSFGNYNGYTVRPITAGHGCVLEQNALYKWRELVLVNAKQTQHGCCGLSEMKLARLGIWISEVGSSPISGSSW